LPLNWAKELKKSNIVNSSNAKLSSNNTTPQSSTTDIIKVTDFPKRLNELQQKNPQSLQNAAQTSRNNYK
jgi:hypothetical protein